MPRRGCPPRAATLREAPRHEARRSFATNRRFLGLAVAALAAFAIGAGCAQNNSSTTKSGGGSTEGEGGSSVGGSAPTTTSTSSATTGSGGGATGTGGATSAGGSTPSGGSGQGGSEPTGGGDHVLIAEIGVAPASGEFIEVYNPTNAAIALDDYYLSDNATYTTFTNGQPWNPPTDNPGTDFLARFPKGTTLAPGAVLVVATDPTYKDAFGACPDFTLKGTFDGCSTKAMNAPVDGSIGASAGLSNSREMIVLFHWDGDAAHDVEDVDYVTWGTDFDDNTRVDKTGQGSYKPNTARASQKAAAAPPPTQSIERCKAEPGEKTSGGNGLTGHDETSEDLAAAFTVQAKPTPGKKNACL